MDFLVLSARPRYFWDMIFVCRDAIYKVLRYRSSFDIELKVGVMI